MISQSHWSLPCLLIDNSLLSELSVISWVSTVEGYLLGGVALYLVQYMNTYMNNKWTTSPWKRAGLCSYHVQSLLWRRVFHCGDRDHMVMVHCQCWIHLSTYVQMFWTRCYVGRLRHNTITVLFYYQHNMLLVLADSLSSWIPILVLYKSTKRLWNVNCIPMSQAGRVIPKYFSKLYPYWSYVP